MKIILTILLSVLLSAVSAQAVSIVECSFVLDESYNYVEIYDRGSNFIAFGNNDKYDNEKYNFGHFLTHAETQYSPEDGGRESVIYLTQVKFVSEISHRYYHLDLLTNEITIIKKAGNGPVVAYALPMDCTAREGGE